MISVVIPLYKCSLSINELHSRLVNELSKICSDYELIFVNDASPENDWQIVKSLASNHHYIKAINLSRNFGQHAAIYAGLKSAIGEWIVVMDGDLQDQPEEIEKLWGEVKNGFKVILAQRVERKDNFFKVTTSKLFYKVFSYLTDTTLDPSIANFGLYHKDAIEALLKMNDYVKFFPVMIQWVGFDVCKVKVNHGFREKGVSSYSFSRLIQLSITIIIAFSDKLLKMSVKLGFFISATSLIFGLAFLMKYLFNQITQVGWTSLILSLWFLSGIIISILGIVGLYIGKIFDQVKERPVYIIKERINL